MANPKQNKQKYFFQHIIVKLPEAKKKILKTERKD